MQKQKKQNRKEKGKKIGTKKMQKYVTKRNN